VRAAAPAQPVDHAWVAVRAAFTCNSCRFLAPLDQLDADGAVECAHCGLRQRFEIELWRQGLEFAHGVGDLAGPELEGRNPHPVLWIGSENPHVPTGTTRTFEHATFGALALDVAPGHPVCGRCREPVQLSVPRPGAVQTLCPRCGDRATHAISDAAVALCPSLVAAVSEEHRSDRPRARATATQAGVVALNCPSCGAPLELGEAGTVHTCRYCRASCVVPHQSVARALRKTPEPAVWWLFFQGLSEERKALLGAGDQDKAAPGEGAKHALRLLKLGKPQPIGDAPGVYEAPEQKGRNYLQLVVTLGLGGLALAIGFVLIALASTFTGK
jgi:DNA-directed RNA polymerase subunit RPC12/RpoP